MNNQKKYLDPEIMFCCWKMTGSINRAYARLKADGIYNPYTMEDPSIMGIWNSARQSRGYKLFQAKRDPDLGGKLPPDAPITREELEYCMKYYVSNIRDYLKSLDEIRQEVEREAETVP